MNGVILSYVQNCLHIKTKLEIVFYQVRGRSEN